MNAKKVAYRHLYARIKRAMSMEDALDVLGFPPGSHPSSSEVNQAHRKLVFENHPDRGGDPSKMVEINVAKDILSGSQRPSPPSGSSSPSTSYEPPPPPAPPLKISFDEAMPPVPGNVKWLFVTPTAYSGYSGDESERQTASKVIVGDAGDRWVALACEHRTERDYYVGSPKREIDTWRIDLVSSTKGNAPPQSELYKLVLKAWKTFENTTAKWGSKIIPVEDGYKPSSRSPSGRKTTIKNYAVNMGLVEEEELTIPRKITVEVEYREWKGYEGKMPSDFVQAFKYRGEGQKITLIINGKEYRLSPDEMKRLARIKIKGKDFVERVFGRYASHSERPKNLTRNKDGKLIMGWMAEKLTGMPDWVRKSLEAAAKK